ncbi:Ribosomal-protein-S18p-alanine acetyltransferase [hydrothermal vent metagenome]|uniref:Ribosomal-protein-S18p-alanine acetyltransferase n=1 Tax=hydrothermal vent metagenome TaxID=652676 RepID=A0A3B0UK47_9ZZZZ
MIKSYSPEYKLDLLLLLRLNTPYYFNQSEEIDLIKYLDEQIEDYYVIELNNKIIGCGGINYEPDKNAAIISWDIIHPDFQRKGLGKELLTYRIDRIKKMGIYPQVIVRTSQFTNNFYKKNGFKLIETVKDYWAKGIDLYYMVLKLKPSFQSQS